MIKSNLLLIVLFSLFITQAVFSQKEYNLNELHTYEDTDGRYIFKVIAKKKKLLNGECKILYNNYKKEYIIATFRRGMYDGLCRKYNNLQLEYEINYKEGYKNGVYKRYSRFGDLASEGTFTNDKMHGVVITYYYSGQIESANIYREGKLHGLCRTYTNEGKLKSEQEYTEGLANGFERRYSGETGDLIVNYNYKNGQKEGKQFCLHAGCNDEYTEDSFYIDGKMEGVYKETYTNGRIRTSGIYKNGKKEGIWVLYDKSGQIMWEQNFINGKTEEEQKCYYPDGSLEAISNHINGEEEGLRKEYYMETGILKSEYIFMNGLKEGRYKCYYEDGMLREEGHFESGYEMYIKEYYRNGKLKSAKERKSDGSWDLIEQYDVNGRQL